jgi:hypothetical protein
MKNLLFVLCSIVFINTMFAQKDLSKDLNKQSLEEFGVKGNEANKNFNLPKAEQPTIGNNQEELNRKSLEQFNNLYLKYKKNDKQDTTKKEQVPYEDIKKRADSLLNIIKKNQVDSILNVKKNLEKQNSNKPIVPNKPEIKVPAPIKDSIKVIEKPTISVSKPTSESKPNIQNKTDFSNEPITKPKLPTKTVETNSTNNIKPKIDYDSLKNKPIKDFYIETQPVVNQNGKLVAVEEAKQVEVKKPSETKYIYSEKEIAEKAKKEKFNQYQRDADSIRYKNKQLLDSLLATLNVDVPVQVDSKDYIEIFVSGGGLYGGLNPKEYDRIMIYNNGILQREYKSKLAGIEKYEKKIMREDIVKLAQYIVDLGFFKFYEEYECKSDDVACKQRMKQAPSPIPLTISVAIGVRRQNITVDLYAPKIEKNWVNYPENLEKILNAIYALSEK